MTNKHYTEMLVDDWKNNNHNSGKMEIGECIKRRILKGTKMLSFYDRIGNRGQKVHVSNVYYCCCLHKPNFHVKILCHSKKFRKFRLN